MHNHVLHSGKFLTAAEDQAFLNRVTKDNSRNALMLLILRTCGLRGIELRSLRVLDLHPSTRSIYVRAAKGSNNRELKLPEYVFNRLISHVNLMPRNADDLVFPVSKQWLGEIWRGFRPIGCGKGSHSLRHTFALEAYRTTKDIHFVKNLLGHKSINSTMIYLEFANTADQMDHYIDSVWTEKFVEKHLKVIK